MKDDKELVAFAKRALRGLDESSVFVGVYGDGPMNATRAAFLMQLGYAVLASKPIIVPVAHGTELPPKLAAVADCVVWFNPDDPDTLQHGMEKALTEIGAKLQ